jgi:hypothetical protein
MFPQEFLAPPAMKKEAVVSSETVVTTYRIVCCHSRRRAMFECLCVQETERLSSVVRQVRVQTWGRTPDAPADSAWTLRSLQPNVP